MMTMLTTLRCAQVVLLVVAFLTGDPTYLLLLGLGVVLQKGSFGDLLDPRFREITTDESQLRRSQDMIPFLFNVTTPTTPQRQDERYSELSDLPVAGQFTGSIDYAAIAQGYDVTGTYVEFGQGIQIERTLVEYDQKNLIEERPRALALSMWRRRQRDALRMLRNAFSVDTLFYNHTEGVALCSDSHTTTTSASTTSGFDNLLTSAFSAAQLAVAQIQMRNFRDLQGEPIQAVGDTIIIPFDLYEQGYEVISSMGKVDTAQNNRNVHYGAYTLIVLPEKVSFPDTNDWFLADMELMKRFVLWFDQVYPGGQPEFGFTEEFDTFIAKYRAYMRYMYLIRNWRFILGNSVS